MALKKLAIALLPLCLLTCCARHITADLHTGDLIFQDLDCGDLCDAIESVTKSQFHVKGPALSHVGIVIEKGDQISILEAYGEKISLSPLKTVLDRAQNSQPRIIHSSALRGLPPDFGERIEPIAEEYVGAPYDEDFTWGDGKYYCSELVADIFRRLVGREYFAAAPMTFGESGSKLHGVWKNYFAKRGIPIPEGKPGISPLGIWMQATAADEVR